MPRSCCGQAKPATCHSFLSAIHTKVPEDAPPLPVRFMISWRKTSSRLPQIPVKVTSSTQDIKDIAAAAASKRPL